MDLPFFFFFNNTINPLSCYHPLPRQWNRFPSISRGHIYGDSPLHLPERHETTTPTSTRDHYFSTGRSSSTASLAPHNSNRRRTTSHPLPPLSRAMQAASAPSSRPSLAIWPFHTPATAANKPSLSFSRAARDLSSTLADALDYFKPLYAAFREEIKDIRTYADDAVIDQVWMKKISSDGGEGNVDTAAEHGEENDGGEGGGNENETPTARDFRDHQAAVYNRCEDVLCAVPPPALRTRMRGRNGFGADVHCSSDGSGLEAAALVAKLARCREDLFPALWRMGSRYAVVGTAIKEMEVLKSHLETYRGVWDVGGGRK